MRLMAAAIGTGASAVGEAHPLFEFDSQAIVSQGNQFVYSPSLDGQRFLVDEFASDEEATVDIILNWASTQPTAQ